MRVRRRVLAALLAASVAAGACRGDSGEERGRVSLTVGAAVSLTESLSEIATAFEQAEGIAIRLNLAASNTVASQILAGAPVDVFLSADDEQFDRLVRAGLVDRASRRDVIGNRLVLVQPPDAPRQVRSPRDLLDPLVGRVAIGEPAAVPAGRYARRALERDGVWVTLEASGRLVPGASVRASLAAVAQGIVQAGIVYASDVRTTSGVNVAYEWPPSPADPIVYPGGVVKASTRAAEARRFLAYLGSPQAQAVLERHGFRRLGEPSR